VARRMNSISTHILDIARGVPAKNVPVQLERQETPGNWRPLVSGRTDRDGRCSDLLPEGAALLAGLYRLTFDTASYYAAEKIEGLYPVVQVTFAVRNGETRFHIPLLLTQNGYTTYRGS
jgi:5-hydroxyisourate hydrolase